MSVWLFNNVNGWSSKNERSDKETKDGRNYYRLQAMGNNMVLVDGRAFYR